MGSDVVGFTDVPVVTDVLVRTVGVVASTGLVVVTMVDLLVPGAAEEVVTMVTVLVVRGVDGWVASVGKVVVEIKTKKEFIFYTNGLHFAIYQAQQMTN